MPAYPVGVGAGAEAQKPLATVLIGGTAGATCPTMVVLPKVFRLWHRNPFGPPASQPAA